MSMPTAKTIRTGACWRSMAGMRLRSQADPIWFTMFFAVRQASSFARAGSKLDPLRKNRRVKVMKTKVWKTAQALEIQATAGDSGS